jgi:hypothetical protein
MIRREFHARVTLDGYTLHCRRCGTYEALSRDALLHDVAGVHVRWFHQWGKPQLPPMGRVV